MKLSIIIPCYNESLYISKCLDSLLDNDFSDEYEILIIDGGSTDGTLSIIDNYTFKYNFIKIVHNEKKIKPIALNLGIESAKGDVIMRIDAHACYAKNYISKLVNGIDIYNADNIGGLRHTYKGSSLIENSISVLTSHPFSVGNAYWRTGSKEVKEVDTVFCGCYRKSIFDKIGLFNVNLIRAQDREFNYRLKAAGGKIVLDPSIKIDYFPRQKIYDFFK